MGKQPNKPVVFISYSHKDEKWKDLLHPHLEALVKDEQICLWDDRKIDTGDDWYPKIETTMGKAAVAVCLISADYLSSDFITKEEIPFLLKRREAEGMLLLPLVVEPCAWQIDSRVNGLQMFLIDEKNVVPLAAIENEVKLKQVFADFAVKIHTKLNDPDFKIPKPASEWSELDSELIDIHRLPQTGKEVFGRDKELAMLDDAWASSKNNVVSLVAWGGVGKSALVNKWVSEMGADNYRGAERVFAWSFYSQGTGERVTSADLFISDALIWFGDPETAGSNRSPWDKGRCLAELIQAKKTLLLLDGLEPLQSGQDFDRGTIKDPALGVMLKELAKKNSGLCVVTTREKVKDIALDTFKDSVIQNDLEQISPEAGRALLRVGGVRGTDAELEKVTRDFGCHALAVNLLVTYLEAMPGHNIADAANIPDLDVPVEKGKHPRRVMEAFAQRFGEGPELELLRIMGLFDRPVPQDVFRRLVKKPKIKHLTWNLSRSTNKEHERIIQNLRHYRLLASESHRAPGALDAHPLVREHFGEKLEKEYPEAWKEAHGRLYEHYRDKAKEFPENNDEMQLLYAAVGHGCKAGRHKETMDEVYWKRIQRGNESFNIMKLGALGADLAVLSGFFDVPWSSPVTGLTENDKSWVLNEAGFDLRALGRLAEATQPMKAGLELYKKNEDWRNAAQVAANLSELYLTIGEVGLAVDYAGQGVDFADCSGDTFHKMSKRTTQADALHQAGRLEEAEDLFREAEDIQREYQPEYPLLYSLQGYQYCDLLLARGKFDDVFERAKKFFEWRVPEDSLLTIALDNLSLGRAYLMIADRDGTGDYADAKIHLDRAVDGLRQAGTQEHLLLGLLARAGFNRLRSDYDAVHRDLEETMELATRCGMRLHETDAHLEYARIYLAMVESDPAKADEYRVKAGEHAEKAGKLVEDTGYHRRDGEVEEPWGRLKDC